MKIQENIPLAEYTTFKTGGPARFFSVIENEQDLIDAVAFVEQKKLASFVLGGGSNVLMSDKGFDGFVMKMEITGIERVTSHPTSPEASQGMKNIGEGEEIALLSVGAGVQWDTFVEYAVEHGLYGVENLSAIPGTVGAAPVQNIGAYGSEVSQTVHSVRAFDIRAGKFVDILNADCRFSYRDSIFKKEKGRYIITLVTFALKKDGVVNIEYRDVKEYFEGRIQDSRFKIQEKLQSPADTQVTKPSLKDVRAAIIDIRWNKLPDWKLWGTAGSFFKNPLICTEHYEGLKKRYPDLPGYPETKDVVKVPLGWILDKICNMKGICVGNVCVYEKQALVLVAKPGATSEEVVKLAQSIMKTVKEKTDIDVEAEVEWVN